MQGTKIISQYIKIHAVRPVEIHNWRTKQETRTLPPYDYQFGTGNRQEYDRSQGPGA